MKLLFDENLSRHLIGQPAFLHGPPPKVVWLRVGNASTSEFLTVLLDHVEAIEAFESSEDEALLVLPVLRST